MSVEIEFRDIALSQESKNAFVGLVRGLYEGTVGVADQIGYPAFDVTVVLSGDFVAAVDQSSAHLRAPGEPRFTADRLGGTVAAKCIAQNDDCSRFDIVVSPEIWTDNGSEISPQSILVLAHEMAHAIFECSKRAVGALDGVHLPSITGTEYARAISRIAADEFRADLLANAVLGALGSVDDQGSVRPVTADDIFGQGHDATLRSRLDDTVHPGWPDTVHRYRTRQIVLQQLISSIVESTEQVFTLVAHAESTAVCGGRPSPLAETFVGHPGVRLYLLDAWRELRDAVGLNPLPPWTVLRAYEDEIASRGATAILRMWKILGMTVEEHGNREWSLWVTDPQR